jgi:hypothetical protein
LYQRRQLVRLNLFGVKRSPMRAHEDVDSTFIVMRPRRAEPQRDMSSHCRVVPFKSKTFLLILPQERQHDALPYICKLRPSSGFGCLYTTLETTSATST